MKETTATGLGSAGATAAGNLREFLRKASYASLLLPLLWIVGTGLICKVFSIPVPGTFRFFVIPIWLGLAVVCAYYFLVLASLYAPTPLTAAILGSVSLGGAIVATVVAGLEAGVTVAFSLSLAICAVHVHAVSLMEFLDAKSLAVRIGVYTLCAAGALSPIGAAVGLFAMYMGTNGLGAALAAAGLGILLVSLAPIAVVGFLSWKARKVARGRLEGTDVAA